jgi:hypothetical protein
LSTSDRPTPAATDVLGATLVMLLTLVLPAPTARAADDPTAGAQPARAKAVEAERLYEQKDFQAALQRLEEAYALYPSAKIHYNFALAQQALGQEPRAMESFERFLAEAPDAEPKRRQHAAEKVAELRKRLVWLEVDADTHGAEVLVDGRVVGTTPLPRGLWMSAVPHQVVVKQPGATFGYTARIDPAPGASTRVEAHLRPMLDAITAGAAPSASPAQLGVTGQPWPPPARSPWWRRSGWIAAGAAGVSLTTMVVGTLVKNERTNDFNRLHEPSQSPGRCLVTAAGATGPAPCQKLLDGMNRARSWAVGGLIGTGVFTVASVVAFVLAPPATPAAAPTGPILEDGPSRGPILSFGPGTLLTGWSARF